MWRRCPVVGGALLATLLVFVAEARAGDLELLVREDFSGGADRWEPTDPAAWEIATTPEGPVYRLARQSKYQPPHRSPVNISLLKDVAPGDFELTVRVHTTARSYGHRDMCLFFGYQDPAHFYYVHFGQRADEHANQIFIVNDAPRKMISQTSNPGTPWTEDWHRLKLVRRVADGTIAVYFDDFDKPAMTAIDKTFLSGRIGLGSFDDTGEFDDLELRGAPARP
ncbi:MAG: hypothetical protein K1X74_07600 [Pirellulales bacterium]|nr:hypothetical protein [Pirellulales bacterium]